VKDASHGRARGSTPTLVRIDNDDGGLPAGGRNAHPMHKTSDSVGGTSISINSIIRTFYSPSYFTNAVGTLSLQPGIRLVMLHRKRIHNVNVCCICFNKLRPGTLEVAAAITSYCTAYRLINLDGCMRLGVNLAISNSI